MKIVAAILDFQKHLFKMRLVIVVLEESFNNILYFLFINKNVHIINGNNTQK